MHLDTILIHAGMTPDPSTGAIIPPIYQTSTYVQDAPAVNKGYEYARSQNPTRTALEMAYAAIENAQYGLAFSSGVAATDAVLKLLDAGDEVIASQDLYGGSFRLFTQVYERLGIRFKFLDTNDTSLLRSAITPKTKLFWVETPTNPLMKITDIAAVAALAKEQNCILCVDNTFASPCLQNPLNLGATIVMHSATKYLNGHSDVIQGCLMLNDETLYKKLYFIQKSSGAIPSPQDCFLALRGLKTLALRMERHCSNGAALAHWLRQHPMVEKVYWAGFEDSAGYTIACKQMRDFGGMMSIELKNSTALATKTFLTNTHLFSLAESLGGVESLINHPATMTHASIPEQIRLQNGLSNHLIRLSVGIENIADLQNDLEKAFRAIEKL